MRNKRKKLKVETKISEAECEEVLSAADDIPKNDSNVDKLFEILRIELIADKIFSELTVSDLKAASETCVNFCNSIRSNRNFQNTAVFVISNKKHSWDTMLKFMATSDFPWVRVRICIDQILPLAFNHLPIETTVAFQNVLSSCKTLSLVANSLRTNATTSFCNCCKSTFKASLLNLILKWTPKLTHLQVDSYLLKQTFLEDIPTSDIATAVLENLKNLDILEWNRGSSSFTPWYYQHQRLVLQKGSSGKKNPPVEGFQRFQNLLQLLQSANNLQSLRLCNIHVRHGLDWERGISPTRNYLLPILYKNVHTLVELTAFDNSMFFLPTYNQLKILSVGICNKYQQTMLAKFLLQHENLEELGLRFEGEGLDQQLSRALEERKETIKKLHLKLSMKLTNQPREFEWNFYQSMPRLNDFALSILRDSSSGQKYLESLPRNKLQKLSLENVGQHSWFWEARGDAALHVKQDILMGLSTLTILHISHCPSMLDDNLLKFILAEFNKLKELEILSCGKISHEGFIERDVHGKVVSCSNKKHVLEELIINMPWRNSKKNLGLLFHSISFPALRYLKFMDCNKSVPDEFVIDLMKLNPSLETFCGRFKSEEDFQRLFDKLKKIPRVRFRRLTPVYKTDCLYLD